MPKPQLPNYLKLKAIVSKLSEGQKIVENMLNCSFCATRVTQAKMRLNLKIS